MLRLFFFHPEHCLRFTTGPERTSRSSLTLRPTILSDLKPIEVLGPEVLQ